MNPRIDRASADQVAAGVLPAYERQVDGLFTYCLSVLCEHDAAVAAVREVRELALRGGARLADPGLLRAWLYSLARYSCVRRLAEEAGEGSGTPAHPAPGEADRRRRELASLTWPEAAGTTAEQREALELSVRHRLTPSEVAAVLGLGAEAAQRLLADAAVEVGRTRGALLVLGVGSCPELARLGGAGAEHWRARVLGPALRRELVRHVVECPTCRGTAERVAGEVGAGLAGLPGLAVLPAPMAVRAGTPACLDGWAEQGGGPGSGERSGRVPPPRRGSAGACGAAFLAGVAAGRRAVTDRSRQAGQGERSTRASGEPDPARGVRFDQQGFPRHRAPGFLERHRAGGDLHERAVLVRQRAVTTGVLAAVLSAPLVALWLAHRDDGVADASATVSTVRVDEGTAANDGRPGGAEPDAARPLPATGTTPGAATGMTDGDRGGGNHAAAVGPPGAETLPPSVQGAVIAVPADGAVSLDSPGLHAEPVPVPHAGPTARLTVEATAYGARTVLTLTDSGDTALEWRAVPTCDWLRLSRDSGSLAPGQRITVTVTVDDQRAPAAHWTAQISLPPSEAVVTLEGGPDQPGGGPTPGPPASSSASPVGRPSANPSGSASSTPSVAPTAGSSASTAPSSSVNPSASPTSGPSSPSARPSSSPTARPTPSIAPSRPPSSPAPTSATSRSSSPAR